LDAGKEVMIVLPMRRDIARLSDEEFDLLIIGAGIHGAAAAWSAARQGLSTALIERGDFGHATSANSLKIIHGGLRYLQQGDFTRMRDSILARRQMQQLAPHSVRPLACVTPTHGFGSRSRLAMGAALALNDLVGRDRNRGLPPPDRIPRGRIISRGEMIRIAPGLETVRWSGGALWYDCLAENTERLTLAFVLSAADSGACAANYVEAVSLLRTDGAVAGARARDILSGDSFTIRAGVTIDAGGPWTGGISGSLPESSGLGLPARWAKATNLFVPRPLVSGCALGLRGAEGGQVFFLVPWKGGTMIGTWYREHRGATECRPGGAEVAEMAADVNRVCPAAELRPGEVCFSHAGLVPLRAGGGDIHRRLEGSARVIDFARQAKVEGMIGVYGVKYTTACRVAEEAVRLAALKAGRRVAPEPYGPLVGTFDGSLPPRAKAALDGATLTRMKKMYGAAAGTLFDSLAADPALARLVSPTKETVAAEVVHGVREEMALKLSDIVLRRSPLGSAGSPGKDTLRACAALMAAELGWSAERVEEEVSAAEEVFSPYRQGTA
jgi:glycerol-3-phosphate dehydrogenase